MVWRGRADPYIAALGLCVVLLANNGPADAASSLMETVRTGTLRERPCAGAFSMSCSEIFSVLVRGRFHTVAPKAVIESRDSDALHRLFPNCRIALPDGKTDFLATEDKADPLYERNETDHLDFLPQGPFQVFGVKVGKTKEQILIATGYAQPNGVDGNFTYAYLLEPRHPCKPTFIATAGYPSRSDGERQELHVILMRGKPYILSLTDFTPGGSALFIRLTEIPRYGVSRRHWKYASMSTN